MKIMQHEYLMINDILEIFIAKFHPNFSCKMKNNGKEDITKYDDLNDSLMFMCMQVRLFMFMY
jgi:hypothetical protein